MIISGKTKFPCLPDGKGCTRTGQHSGKKEVINIPTVRMVPWLNSNRISSQGSEKLKQSLFSCICLFCLLTNCTSYPHKLQQRCSSQKSRLMGVIIRALLLHKDKYVLLRTADAERHPKPTRCLWDLELLPQILFLLLLFRRI